MNKYLNTILEQGTSLNRKYSLTTTSKFHNVIFIKNTRQKTKCLEITSTYPLLLIYFYDKIVLIEHLLYPSKKYLNCIINHK